MVSQKAFWIILKIEVTVTLETSVATYQPKKGHCVENRCGNLKPRKHTAGCINVITEVAIASIVAVFST